MEQGTRSDEKREIERVGWRVREEEDGSRRKKDRRREGAMWA